MDDIWDRRDDIWDGRGAPTNDMSALSLKKSDVVP